MVSMCVQAIFTAIFIYIYIFMLQIKVVRPEDSKCNKKIDLAIVLDSSASTGRETYKACKEFAKKLMKRFDYGKDRSRLSVMSYSFYFHIPIRFKDFDKAKSFEETINSLSFEQGATFTDRALQIARFEMFSPKYGSRPRRKDVKRVAVFFTDGQSTTGWEESAYFAKPLKENGIQLFVVALGKRVSEKEVYAIASKPTNVFHFARDQASNNGLLHDLVKAICK